jgi:phosphate transport system substrate-binding protein
MGVLAATSPVMSAATLSGSDLLKGRCAEVLQKETAGVVGGVKLTLDGSLMGEKYLRNGTADAALLIIPDKSKVKEIAAGDWVAVPIAYQTIVVAVNKLNKLNQIDLETLAAIYGKQQSSEIKHWSAVPTSGIDLTIFPVSTRYDIGVIAPLFRNRVLHDGEYKETVGFRSGDADAEEFVRANTNAIGILSVPPANDRVKTLALLAPGTNNAYMPTPSNLHNGDYPLAIPLYFVFPKKNAAKIKPLLPVVFGDPLSASLQGIGFVAAPKDFRTNFAKTLDKLP